MGLSRNKVAVPEGAAGSPPFYGVFLRTPVWRPSCGPCAGNGFRSCVGVLVWKRSLASRVSVGGLRAVVWVCFWVPGPPPATWSRAVFRMSPWGGRPAGVPCPDRCLGAWWFENWIVDASNAMIFLSSFALSRFRQALFLESGFEIDRFVIIFYSVMICRLA